jgi:hypothetical protein
MIVRIGSIVAAGAMAVLVGCASAPPPTIQTGPQAEVTVDGLHRVDNARMGLVYMKPQLDLTRYTKVMLDPVSVAYKKDPGDRRSTQMAGQEANFALRPSQMEELKSWFQEAVVEALEEDDGYEIVETPAPDVLLVTARLVDLIVRVPTETAGRSRSAASSYGEVTLIVEVFDSETGEILARAADRRDPTQTGTRNLSQVSSVYVRADTERMFRHWAEVMRTRMDELKAAATP